MPTFIISIWVKNMRKMLASAAFAVVSLATAATASTMTVTRQDPLFGANNALARNVNINYDGANNYVSAGMFHLTGSNGVGDFVAFCVDLAQKLGKPTQSVEEKSDLFGASILTNIDKLFSSVIGTSTMASAITTGVKAAGFQIALWEIISDDGSFNLADGKFQLKEAQNSTVWQQAQTYLDGLTNADTGKQTLTYYYSRENQDLVTGTPNDLQEPGTVPVPASGLLILAGLGSLVAMRRRKAA